MCADALSWQQLTVLTKAFKAASSSNSLLVSEAAEVMLKAGTTVPGLSFPWKVSSPFPYVRQKPLSVL